MTNVPFLLEHNFFLHSSLFKKIIITLFAISSHHKCFDIWWAFIWVLLFNKWKKFTSFVSFHILLFLIRKPEWKEAWPQAFCRRMSRSFHFDNLHYLAWEPTFQSFPLCYSTTNSLLWNILYLENLVYGVYLVFIAWLLLFWRVHLSAAHCPSRLTTTLY